MPGDSQVWCFSCHYGGTQNSLILELRHLVGEGTLFGKGPVEDHGFQFPEALRALTVSDEEDSVLEDFDFSYEEMRERKEVEPFPEWFVGNFEPAYHCDPYHDENTTMEQMHPYLTFERDVTYAWAQKYDVRHDTHLHRIGVPVRDYHGRLTGFHGRAIGSQEPRYRMYPYENRTNPQVWLGEHLVDRNDPVVFVESVFDLANVWEVYENVMSPLRSGINADQIARVTWAREVVCFFDNDEAGHHAFERVRDGLGNSNTAVHAVWPPDGKDPGNLSPREIAELLDPFLGE